MPPKRWGHALGVGATKTHKEALVSYVRNEIQDNNHLGLLGDELENMVSMLVTCGTREEVHEWCQTLLLGEALAAEVIKRRAKGGPPFQDGPVKPGKTQAVSHGAKGSRTLNLCTQRRGKNKASLNKNGNNSSDASLPNPVFFECGCFATEHSLRGNCANCGRIICEKESDEMCYSCGLDPAVCVAYEIKIQDGLLSAAAQEKNREMYEAAVSRRDELLKYAETRTKRTKVIDDQTSVFLSPKHAWMTTKERNEADENEALAERRRKVAAMHRNTGAYTVHLDIMNQNVSLGCPVAPVEQQCICSSSSSRSASEIVEEEEEDRSEVAQEVRALPLPSLMQKIWYSVDGTVEADSFTIDNAVATMPNSRNREGKPDIHRRVEVSRRVQQDYYEDDAQFFYDAQQNQIGGVEALPSAAVKIENIMDEDGSVVGSAAVGESVTGAGGAIEGAVCGGILTPLVPTPVMRMNDGGVCLSMHQPWAGLLVAGIKVHEGRVWSTDYRGRLWIHAASSQPHDIEEVEKRYAKFSAPHQKFPKHYPTRVLLGYVYLMDCMDRETYERTYTPEQRQEESPFSFICAAGKALPFPLPMSGDHKLFRLNHKVHTAAKKQLMEIS